MQNNEQETQVKDYCKKSFNDLKDALKKLVKDEENSEEERNEEKALKIHFKNANCI